MAALKKKVVIDKANRLYQLPPGILSLLGAERRRRLIRRADLVDLASYSWPVTFDPDATWTAEQLAPASAERRAELREALAAWFARWHGVKLNPAREIYLGGNIRSLLFLLSLSYVESGDLAFVPQVGIPLYRRTITACSGEAISYEVSPRNDWRPDFERLGSKLGRVARVLFLNSPHNPTGTELTEKEMAYLAWTAARENILIVNDAAYQSIPDRRPVSLLAVTGGKQVAVEVYSFTYSFGLPSIPFGFVAGNREVINALRQAEMLTPPHIPEYYVDLALTAIRQFPSQDLKAVRTRLAESADAANDFLSKLSLERSGATTTPYLWVKIERRGPSVDAARSLYRLRRILVAPGTGFGEGGQGFLRLSLTAGAEAYRVAAARIKGKMSLFRAKADK